MIRRLNRYKRRSFRNLSQIGRPKYDAGQTIGHFTITRYQGHSDVNKRNNRIMAKPQHWYRCKCDCGEYESRSQQELTDTRRSQCCESCRKPEEKRNALTS